MTNKIGLLPFFEEAGFLLAWRLNLGGRFAGYQFQFYNIDDGFPPAARAGERKVQQHCILKDFYAGFAFADGAANHERLLFQCLSS